MSLQEPSLNASVAPPDPTASIHRNSWVYPLTSKLLKEGVCFCYVKSVCYRDPSWDFSGFPKFNIVRSYKQNVSIILLLSKQCRLKVNPSLALYFLIKEPGWLPVVCDLCKI